MNDKDFDDIGKRLYDQEADPPKNGWKKIGSALNTSQPPGKMVWLRKNWWKPLIILLPVGIYFLYSVQNFDGVTKSSSMVDSSAEKSQKLENDQSATNASTSKEKYNATQPDHIGEDYVSDSTTDATRNEATVVIENQKEPDNKTSPSQSSISSSIYRNEKTKKEVENIGVKKNASERKLKDAIATTPNMREVNEGQGIVVKKQIVGTETQVRSDNKTLSAEENTELNTGSNNEAAVRSNDTVDETDTAQIPNTLTNESQTTNINATTDTATTQDSKVRTFQAQPIKMDTAATSEDKNKENKNVKEKWRMTVSLSPQYVSRTVQPVASDEVLVTGVDRSHDSHKVGFTFGAGAGLSVTENFYLDVQVSYAETQQAIHFSYTTGNVDTLVAIKQPDQTVRVTPIYETANREIASKYGYAGVRLGATHYFWSTSRTRFNVSGLAGVHYLVSSDVKEKLNGNWVSLSNDDLNKFNYTFMISAGYNINLARGWELMINPSLTYYLRKVKNSELPYDLNQQSLGLNFMLSKTLNRK